MDMDTRPHPPPPPNPRVSTLVRTLTGIASGTVQVTDFSRVMLSAAVEDVLFHVAADYRLNYKTLVDKYRDDVVTRHLDDGTAGQGACQGTTKTGKPCTKRPHVNGYCTLHLEQMADDASKRRSLEAYKQELAAKVPSRAVAAAAAAKPVVPVVKPPHGNTTDLL
jgi:hypothetical protein